MTDEKKTTKENTKAKVEESKSDKKETSPKPSTETVTSTPDKTKIKAILIPGFFIGAQYGSQGMALSWLFCFLFSFMIASYRSCNALSIGFSKFIGSVYKPHVIGLFMLAGTWFLGQYLLTMLPSLAVFIVQVVAGAAIYIGLSFIFARSETMETINLVRNRKRK